MRTTEIVVVKRDVMSQELEDFLVDECDLELNGDTFAGIEFSAYTSNKELMEIEGFVEDKFDLCTTITEEEVEFFDVISRKRMLMIEE